MPPNTLAIVSLQPICKSALAEIKKKKKKKKIEIEIDRER
jgi:hypothetical protein